MKRITEYLLSLALLISLSAPVFADTDYSGYIDPATNEPDSAEEERASETGRGRSRITANSYYDWDTFDFVFTTEDSANEIHSSAANGMVLNRQVSINTGGAASIAVYRDGEEITDGLGYLRTPGEYVVSFRQGGATKRILGFTIVGKTTNAVRRFEAPEGFYITDATLNGEDCYLDRFSVDMEAEGEYYIEYECMETGLTYRLETIIDRTPPSLTLEGVLDSQGRVHSAVTINGKEDGDTIVLLRDGVEVQLRYNSDRVPTVEDSGNYILRVYDEAGNMKEYTFTIMVYFNVSSWMFFLLVAGVIIAVFVYVRMKRRQLKIG